MNEKMTNLKKARWNPEKELPEMFKRFLMRTHNTGRFIRALKSKKTRFRFDIDAVLNRNLLVGSIDWEATPEGDKYWRRLNGIWRRYTRICENGIVIKDN